MGQALFYLYAFIACGGAIAVVLSQNVVRMAFWLVISLCSTALLFFLLDADFVGATQLLIYVGGTVVLLIFGVMLTSSGPYRGIQNSPGEMVQSGIIGLAFLALVSSTVFSVDWSGNNTLLAKSLNAESHEHHGHAHPHDHEHGDEHGHHDHDEDATVQYGYNAPSSGNTTRSLGAALLGVRFDKDYQPEAHGDEHGDHSVSTGYLLPFEIVSIHLLVVLVGAAYLARAKRRVDVRNV